MQHAITKDRRFRSALVALLFFYFVANALNLAPVYREHRGHCFTKSTHGFAKTDAETPLEEKEVEKTEDKNENEVFLAHLCRVVSLLPLVQLQAFHSANSTEALPADSPLPLYLTQRSLII
jgi:hypothetical protein